MMAFCLPLCTGLASILTQNTNPSKHSFKTWRSRKLYACRAASSSSSPITDFDLYDLLGVDSSSDQSHIKAAYRMLQKRCHPDVAGPAGHDMAIILNQAYSVLSDPSSRFAYDKEQAKIAELRGYTGKPIYSVWFGSESEDRAVFVDEVKCVGCLKCALFAHNTFAIESVYGRARVVAQWADPEPKIQEAIETCPVDCISIVERSDLAALEFLMSKQPRGNVRVGAGNSVGSRVSNIFVDVKKFQTRFSDAMKKADKGSSKATDPEREARISAIQAIRSISNWLYWQSPNGKASTSGSNQSLTHIARKKSPEPEVERVRRAAAAMRKREREGRSVQKAPLGYIYHEEYWVPSIQALPSLTKSSCGSMPGSESQPLPTIERKDSLEKDARAPEKHSRSPVRWGIPIGSAIIAAVTVWLQVGDGVVGEMEEHIGGTLAMSIVNSSWLQVALAGITWYFIGVVIVELVEAIRNR